VLPAWYPRTPLRDVTAVVRVIIFFFVLIGYNLIGKVWFQKSSDVEVHGSFLTILLL
jgi:hypothetical protein